MTAKRPILVLLPTLNRTASLCAAFESLMLNSTGLADVLVIAGEFDGTVAALNSVPRELLSGYDIIGLFGDDVRMRTPGWDSMVSSSLNGKCGLVYGRDGHQDQRLCTHPFVSTSIFRVLGFIHPPELHHFYGDNFLMELLGPIGKAQFLADLFTEHLHPDTGKSVADETFRKSQRWWDADSVAWREYSRTKLPDDRAHIAQSCP